MKLQIVTHHGQHTLVQKIKVTKRCSLYLSVEQLMKLEKVSTTAVDISNAVTSKNTPNPAVIPKTSKIWHEIWIGIVELYLYFLFFEEEEITNLPRITCLGKKCSICPNLRYPTK